MTKLIWISVDFFLDSIRTRAAARPLVDQQKNRLPFFLCFFYVKDARIVSPEGPLIQT